MSDDILLQTSHGGLSHPSNVEKLCWLGKLSIYHGASPISSGKALKFELWVVNPTMILSIIPEESPCLMLNPYILHQRSLLQLCCLPVPGAAWIFQGCPGPTIKGVRRQRRTKHVLRNYGVGKGWTMGWFWWLMLIYVAFFVKCWYMLIYVDICWWLMLLINVQTYVYIIYIYYIYYI